MNIVFMGTPTYALPTLNALAAKNTVRAVFSRPDAASHRGKKLLPSLVKARALELGLPVYTPKSFYAHLGSCSPLLSTEGNRVVDAEVIAQIKKYDPDLLIVAAYGLLLPEEILALPTKGCINLHASLLPRWRGAAPIQRALLAGDEQVGVSIMRMEKGLDTGPYCAQSWTSAASKNYSDLSVELGIMGAELVDGLLESLASQTVTWVEQDENLVTYADKVLKGSINLDPSLTAKENYNRVRASSHHARCKTTLCGKSVMVLQAAPADDIRGKGVYYECKDGLLEILLLKPDGGREMTGISFLAGLR